MNWLDAHRRLSRGKAEGTDKLLAAALWPFSLIYGLGMSIRNLAFDLKLAKPVKIRPYLISVGSLSAGGAGKTPLVALLANRLHQLGHRVLIAATGYGAISTNAETRLLIKGDSALAPNEEWRSAGEEAILLSRMAPAVPIMVGRKREAADTIATRHNLNPDLVILDSGFQYRRLARDLDIVMIDASTPPAASRLLPLGDRREGWASLRRADIIILHRAELCLDHQLWERHIIAHAPSASIYWCSNRLSSHRPLGAGGVAPESDESPIASLAGKRVGVWTGLGNPASFVSGLRAAGIDPVITDFARDHAPVDLATVEKLSEQVTRYNLDHILVTEKDGIKMEGFADQLQIVRIVKAELDLSKGETQFWPELLERIPGQ